MQRTVCTCRAKHAMSTNSHTIMGQFEVGTRDAILVLLWSLVGTRRYSVILNEARSPLALRKFYQAGKLASRKMMKSKPG